MSMGTFINYWIGEDSIPLNKMPEFVDVTPLAFVGIDKKYQLNFDFLCTKYPAPTIQDWIKTVRTHGTKVLFSINDTKIGNVPDVDAFVKNVADEASTWGVDGVDIDYEPPSENEKEQGKVLEVTKALRVALRKKLGREPLLIAPIYAPWINPKCREFLKNFAQELDFLATMDYTPYPGLDDTKELFEQYASVIGETEKVAIGVNCMSPESKAFTPLEDVKSLCQWKPNKKGMMLYNFSYDMEPDRTKLPAGTFTKTIHECLP